MVSQPAEAGNLSAQYLLGWMYDNGKGVATDRAQARKWYTLAAEHGDPRSQYHLGWLLFEGKGVSKISSWPTCGPTSPPRS